MNELFEIVNANVCPTYVGMNRITADAAKEYDPYAPRMWG